MYYLVGPRIVEQPLAINVTIEVEDIDLSCTATGFPLPNITWFHNDTAIDINGDRDLIINVTFFDEIPGFTSSDFGRVTSVLTIFNSSTNDTGDYRCEANEGVRIEEQSVEVLVLVQGILY